MIKFEIYAEKKVKRKELIKYWLINKSEKPESVFVKHAYIFLVYIQYNQNMQ